MSDLYTDNGRAGILHNNEYEFKPDNQLDTADLARKNAYLRLKKENEDLTNKSNSTAPMDRPAFSGSDRQNNEIETLRTIYNRKKRGEQLSYDPITLNETKQNLLLEGFTEDQIDRGKSKLFNRFQKEDRKKESDEKYKAFFDRANDPNRTLGGSRKLGVGQKSSLYTRNSELKKARRLRKMGFTAAANQVAANWAGSAESKAPSIASQNFLNAREASAQKVDAQRTANERLQRALMERMEEKLKKDPDFMPQIQKPFTL